MNSPDPNRSIMNVTYNMPVLGILGGGQLAKMLSHAAHPLGFTTRVMVHNVSDALPGLNGLVSEGNWNDPAAALKFAQSVDVVTLENEFVNPDSLAAIENAGTPLYPDLSCITLIQDKWHQKQALIAAGLPVVTCEAVLEMGEVVDFAEKNGWPVVLKRRHQGYDGKGNATVNTEPELDEAWKRLMVNESGLFVEAFCPFQRELAVMVCRSPSGQLAVYPVVDTIQKDHICHIVKAPSSLSAELKDKINQIAVGAVTAVGGIGTMGIEMFLTREGNILINELAPRVHNSGHYTIEACHCSQFENHIRAILNLPLGSPEMIHPASVMINLLGQGDGTGVPAGLPDALRIKGAHLHLYGKNTSSRGRKMGHVTAVGSTIEEAEQTALAASSRLTFGNPSLPASR